MAVSNPAVPNIHSAQGSNAGFYETLNTSWHERALQIFMLIVLAHWAEHLVQASRELPIPGGWSRFGSNSGTISNTFCLSGRRLFITIFGVSRCLAACCS